MATQRGAVRLEDMHWLGGRPAALRTPPPAETVRAAPRVRPPAYFRGRTGYDARFIDGLPVPLPGIGGARRGDEARLLSGRGAELQYTHFSSVMSRSRRLPIVTACNLDGKRRKKIPRPDTDVWFLDGRIALEHQIGEELYADNILDRGHMVRREDPVWGSAAQTANIDTFHFTNCAPQVAAMNQRIWLGLEDYILGNAEVHELRVNVFTGPVFRDDDRIYRGVRIPMAYWKVVAIRTPERPSATAYLLSQSKLLDELEFMFGQYKTYQLAIKEIEALTGLDFGVLSKYDGFSSQGVRTGVFPRIELPDWKAIRI